MSLARTFRFGSEFLSKNSRSASLSPSRGRSDARRSCATA